MKSLICGVGFIFGTFLFGFIWFFSMNPIMGWISTFCLISAIICNGNLTEKNIDNSQNSCYNKSRN